MPNLDFNEDQLGIWSKSLAGIPPNAIASALEKCALLFDFPPSIREFRNLCDAYLGMPNVDEAYQMALKRDLSHPLVKEIRQQIGSWEFQNLDAKTLRRKFDQTYTLTVGNFRKEGKSLQRPPANDKIIAMEVPRFNDQLSDDTKVAGEKLNSLKGKIKPFNELIKKDPSEHGMWPKNCLDPSHSDYDPNAMRERRKYLVSLTEIQALNLPTAEDKLDRWKYIDEDNKQSLSQQYKRVL